jgi:dTMP kinase
VPLVSFEGVDGCGKTTQMGRLVRWLEARHERVLKTKEPDGGHIGMAVRSILITPALAGRLSPTEELLLVSAARYDHVRSVIMPALDQGSWVVTDRFYDSTFALQAFQTDVDYQLFEVVTRAVVGALKPDLTIVLDLPADQAQSRRAERAGGGACDPNEDHRDFARIREGFLRMVTLEPQRCYRVDAAMGPDAVEAEVQKLVAGLDLRSPGQKS